eukprot:g43153.t1
MRKTAVYRFPALCQQHARKRAALLRRAEQVQDTKGQAMTSRAVNDWLANAYAGLECPREQFWEFTTMSKTQIKQVLGLIAINLIAVLLFPILAQLILGNAQAIQEAVERGAVGSGALIKACISLVGFVRRWYFFFLAHAVGFCVVPITRHRILVWLNANIDRRNEAREVFWQRLVSPTPGYELASRKAARRAGHVAVDSQTTVQVRERVVYETKTSNLSQETSLLSCRGASGVGVRRAVKTNVVLKRQNSLALNSCFSTKIFHVQKF